MPKLKTVLLDVDGVGADFVGGVLSLFGSELTPLDIKSYGVEHHVGMSVIEFWDKIDAAGPEFWANLDAYSWIKPLYGICRRLVGDVVFVTQPSWSPHCYAGKKLWFDKHWGNKFRDLILTSRKELLAAPDRVLIDDAPHNIEKFRAAGGEAILFPQPWNTENPPCDPSLHVIEKLGGLI